ncbi:MAG TPA: hypothetical protein VGS80_08410 [Ktedonobacterales bacterium]|nr:hypothetical protein [Ktedonobacterales bacterium]
MTDKLKAVISQAEKLTDAEQDALADAWLILLDERGWDARFADPRNQAMMQRMAEQALKEHTTGETEEWP